MKEDEAMMKVYLVWYFNPEVSENQAMLWGLYTTKEKAEKALTECGFHGWINEEVAE